MFGEPLGQATLQSDVPPVEASGGQEWYEDRPIRPELRCTPQVEASGGQDWYSGLFDLSSDVPFAEFFPIAFLISDDKSSSSKVVPWCSNTSD